MKAQATPERTRSPAPAPASASAARVAQEAAEKPAVSEFAGWYLSSYELRQGLTVIHLDDVQPQAMFA